MGIDFDANANVYIPLVYIFNYVNCGCKQFCRMHDWAQGTFNICQREIWNFDIEDKSTN